MASGVRRKAGTSAGRPSAARRLIILWPASPHPKDAGKASSGSRASAAKRPIRFIRFRRWADAFLFMPGVYRDMRKTALIDGRRDPPGATPGNTRQEPCLRKRLTKGAGAGAEG